MAHLGAKPWLPTRSRAVRVLDTALRSRRSISPRRSLRPPSPPQPRPRRRCRRRQSEERGEDAAHTLWSQAEAARSPPHPPTHARTHSKQARRPVSSHASVPPSPVVVRASAPPAAPRLSAPTDRIAASSFFIFLVVSFYFFFFFPLPAKEEEKEQFSVESSVFPGMWMNYWRVVNKCEKKAEARGSASALRPGKRRLSQSCGR